MEQPPADVRGFSVSSVQDFKMADRGSVRGVVAHTVPDRWARRQLHPLVRRPHYVAQRYSLLAEWRRGHLTEVKATSVIDRRY